MTLRGDRKKVLWLSKGLDRGGVEILLEELAWHTALRDFDLHVASVLTRHLQMGSNFESAGVTVHDLGGQSNIDTTWVFNLWRLLKQERFDVIHSHSPLPAAAVRLLSGRPKWRNPLLLSTEHSARCLYHPATRVLNDVTARMDDRRFAVSQAAADACTRFDRRPIEVVYHGRSRVPVVQGERDRLRSTLGIEGSDTAVFCIANMRPEKNLGLLVRAFARANSRATSPMRLVMIGDGQCRPGIESLVDDLELRQSVTMLGSQPEARQWLPAADILALSSDVEGLPVVIMEALQAGVAIVATRVGGIPEVVSSGREGILVAPGNETELSLAMSRLANDRQLLAAFSASALQTSGRFSVEPAAQRLALIYAQN